MVPKKRVRQVMLVSREIPPPFSEKMVRNYAVVRDKDSDKENERDREG